MNAYKRMLLAGFCAGSTILAFGSQAQAAKAASPKVDKTSADLSGKDNILFIRNSVTGRIEARYRKTGIELNEKLHKN